MFAEKRNLFFPVLFCSFLFFSFLFCSFLFFSFLFSLFFSFLSFSFFLFFPLLFLLFSTMDVMKTPACEVDLVIVHGRGGYGGQSWSGRRWPTMQQSCAQASRRPSCLTPPWCTAYDSSCKMLWRLTDFPKVSQHSIVNLAVPIG